MAESELLQSALSKYRQDRGRVAGATPSAASASKSRLAMELRATRLQETVTRVEFPGTELPVDICLISDEDELEARVDAYDYLRERKLKDTAREYQKEWDYAYQIAVLVRCLIDPETNRRAFHRIADLRSLISREEAQALGARWRDHQDEFAPLIAHMTDDDLLKFGDDVKKSRNWALFGCLPASMLRRLLQLQGVRDGTPTGPSSSPTTSDTSTDSASSSAP